MKIIIKKLLEFDLHQCKNNLTKNDALGHLFKTYRLKQKLTLNQFVRSICSGSYLSKIENKKVKPPQTVIDQICERYQITEDEYYIDLVDYHQILDEIISSYYHKRAFNEELLKGTNTNIVSKLVLFSYYVIDNNIDGSISLYSAILNDLLVLTLYQVNFFYFFTGLFLYNNMQNLNAYYLFNMIKDMKSNDELYILTNFYYVKTLVLINKTNLLPQAITTFINLVYYRGLHCFTSELDYLLYVYYLYNYSQGEIDTMLKLTPSSGHAKLFLQALTCFRKKAFEECYGLIKNAHYNEYLKILYLITCDYLQKEEEIITYFKQNKVLGKYEQIIKDFLLLKYQNDKSNHEHFYQSIKLNYLDFTQFQNYYLLRYSINSTLTFFEKEKRYKYAYLLLKYEKQLLDLFK